MIFLYRILINIILILSPIIIIIRILKKKESLTRFKEKFCFFSQKRGLGKVVWFHGASVGELQSIVPLLEKLQKKKDIQKILVTSNTLSSSKIFDKYRLKKVVHQFFPIDTNLHTEKFLNFWKPSSAFFIDSEIWPNMYSNLKKKQIPITLLNGRITKKSFLNWSKVPNFSKSIFSKFDLCLSSNRETINYLKRLGSKNIKFIGNLKFSQSENEKILINSKLKKFISSKVVWCASSTHDTEEKFCGDVHKELKKKYKNLLTILIPRHIERTHLIKDELTNLNLKVHTHESLKMIDKNTDIYIVDAYGKTKTFYNFCKNVFLGGSLINHGGQNPLEAARFGCNIIHGPNIKNFSEIYSFLRINNVSQQINNQKKMINCLDKLFVKKANSKKEIRKKLHSIGKKILENTLKEIKPIL